MRKYSKMLLSVINSFFFFMRRKLGCTKKPQNTTLIQIRAAVSQVPFAYNARCNFMHCAM